MLVILLNCVTLGMYQPCVDNECISNRCKILQMFDDFIFAFFTLEMTVKMIAMGIYGEGTYLNDSWNRLDFFIVIAGALEYCLNVENMNLSAIRTVRVLRPLRAINRIPSMRILVMLLLDTLPMLGNVLLLCFFVFFIFGIIGVQLWEGILRQRCFLKPTLNITYPMSLPTYYQLKELDKDYICSQPDANGMHTCSNLPPSKENDIICNATASPWLYNGFSNSNSCVNWNQYYTECKSQGENPFQGTISFDNIGLAWVAIFVVISLEGWVDIMYYVQDAHSFWDWIYFVLLIVIGSFFMINLCLVVIATQFSETKKREMERMRMERARYHSSSTLASTNNSEPNTCYAEMIKYIAHLYRRSKRRLIKKYRIWKYVRLQKKEASDIKNKSASLPLQQIKSTGIDDKTNNRKEVPNSGNRIQPDSPSQSSNEGQRKQTTTAILKVPSMKDQNTEVCFTGTSGIGNRSRDQSRRPSNVVFNDVVLLHSGDTPVAGENERNICCSEKMTQAGDGNIWPSNSEARSNSARTAMTCQELLALSGALSAALPTGQLALDSLFTSLSRSVFSDHSRRYPPTSSAIRFADQSHQQDRRPRGRRSCKECCLHGPLCSISRCCTKNCSLIQKCIKRLVDHKRFQQAILLAILINTLSMGIEYHNQPDELTVLVEISNVVFSLVFAVEMLLKIIAEGMFGYISNGFNVFDGVIVILSIIELGQSLVYGHEGNSGLSVLRTFRLLRILKLVRFMPNLRRQLFVMLRTMDNVAVFFSLLILFIFIFSILGMNLFGCKFCESEGTCDRKNFDSLLWALVTVFQILTQEDWNIVLFNGMEKTSHWAALYFVALMTFGNYVLFNLLVAILVEGFQSERNERREREQRELARQHRRKYSQCYTDENRSCCSYSEGEEYSKEFHDEFREFKDNEDFYWERNTNRNDYLPKCNIYKENDMCQNRPLPIITHTAATPQDSPNSTMDNRTFNNHLSSILLRNPSLLSLESIDCSTSSQASIDKFDKRPPQITVNNLTETSLPSSGISTPLNETKNNGFSFSRKSSWKLSRRSFNSRNSQLSINEETDEIILNNNNNHLVRPTSQSNHSQCNGGVRNLRLTNNNLLTPHQINSPVYNTGISSSCCNPPPHNSREAEILCERNGGLEECISKTDIPSSQINDNPKQCEENCEEEPRLIFYFIEETGVLKERAEYSLYLFPPENSFRKKCAHFVDQKWFDNVVLMFIALNCITLAMERPNIPTNSVERKILSAANYVFTVVFALEMFVKVIAAGMFYGVEPYFKSGWNIMDGCLVTVSIVDILMSLISDSSPRIFGILRVFRLLRSLRPLRVINRAPGLKLVVQTLLSSLRPIGNIVLICCTFFIIFGILGVQLFKGTFFHCDGPNIKHVRNKTECLTDSRNVWVNRKYNFDDLGKALMSLFVLSSRDGWVNIMYTGLDAVGVDQQPIENYSEWRLLYFISFILLVGFFVLNMFVGVVVENFHRCREEQEKEERVRRLAKRAKQLEKKRKKLREPPYYTSYGKTRLLVHSIVTSKYFDLAIAAVIGLNVITMAMEFYMMPKALTYALKIFNYFFTAVFVLESAMKLLALGVPLYVKDKWNILDVGIVILSIVGIALEEVESKIIPINPTIIRVMRVMRIARVLKLLKMAKGIRALLDTVMQALPQVGNLGLLFFLLFFIFAALGVELFGRLECSDEHPCQGLGEHAHFSNFGMAFLTLFRVATGDNWNGIMKDTLRDDCDDHADCVRNCCVAAGIAPMFFVIFVLMAQFVLVNVVVAVLMKHLEESHKQIEDELDMDEELEREMEQEEDFCMQMALENDANIHQPLAKVLSLPAGFVFNSIQENMSTSLGIGRRASTASWERNVPKHFNPGYGTKRRLTLGPGFVLPSPQKSCISYCFGESEQERQRLIRTGSDFAEHNLSNPQREDIHHSVDTPFGQLPFTSPTIHLIPPSVRNSTSLSNVSTVLAQIETNDHENSISNQPSQSIKNNLDVRLNTNNAAYDLSQLDKIEIMPSSP